MMHPQWPAATASNYCNRWESGTPWIPAVCATSPGCIPHHSMPRLAHLQLGASAAAWVLALPRHMVVPLMLPVCSPAVLLLPPAVGWLPGIVQAGGAVGAAPAAAGVVPTSRGALGGVGAGLVAGSSACWPPPLALDSTRQHRRHGSRVPCKPTGPAAAAAHWRCSRNTYNNSSSCGSSSSR